MISIIVFREYQKFRFPVKEIKRVASYVCAKEQVKEAEVSFVFIGDKKMKAMNKKFLHHPYNTDIITFPFGERPLSAEIYINVEQTKRQAKEYAVSVNNELIRLIVHGTLHVLGYDDRTVLAKKKMFSRQEQYVVECSLR